MKRTTIFLLVLCLFASVACSKKNSLPSQQQTTKRPIVLVSSPPYAYLTEMIAGTTVQVECLTPPGTNPHLFEVPPKHVQKILQSSLWLRLGEPMEAKFLTIFKTHNSNLRILDLSEGISLLDLPHTHHETACSACHHDGQDRHFWMSPALAKQQIAAIATTLEEMFPEHATLYRANLEKSLAQLTQLDEEIRTLFATTHPDVIVISHPALGYFCKDYGIEQLSIETEGKEPLPADVAFLVEKIREKKIFAILVMPQHNSQGALRMADLLNLSTITIDPYATDYPAAIRETASAVARTSLNTTAP